MADISPSSGDRVDVQTGVALLGNADSLDRDGLFELLSSERRRHMLGVLAGRLAPLELRDLAAAVVERTGADGPVDDATDRVALELHHNHLPRMADAGILEYDHESRRVVSIDERVSGGSLPY